MKKEQVPIVEQKVPIVEQEESKERGILTPEQKRKEKEDERMQKLKMKRAAIFERIGDPERMSLKRAKRAILANFRHDPQIYQRFFLRPDLTKRIGRSLCLELKDANNWFLLFKNPNIKFSIPELLFWAIKADSYANLWGMVIIGLPNEERKKHLNFSILEKVLEREDVKNFFETASFFQLIVTASKLHYQKNVWKIILKKITLIDVDEIDKTITIFPVNILFSLIKVAALIPISLFSIFLSLGIDVYLRKYQNTKK